MKVIKLLAQHDQRNRKYERFFNDEIIHSYRLSQRPKIKYSP